ncbi:MAG: hypothetical protein WC366_04745 [Bacilli bacterium]|jgi:hypothetical protein
MKKFLVLLPLLALGLAACGVEQPSASLDPSVLDSESESVSGSASESVSDSVVPTDWSSEQKEAMAMILGEGHYLPFVYISDIAFGDYGWALYFESASSNGAVLASLKSACTSAGFSMGDAAESGVSIIYGTKSADDSHYWYLEAYYDSAATEDAPFYGFAQYLTISETYPSSAVSSLFSAAQAAVIPAMSKPSTDDHFEFMGHIDSYDCGNIVIDLWTSSVSAASSAYVTSLTSNGFVYDEDYECYINETQSLIVSIASYTDYFEALIYAL